MEKKIKNKNEKIKNKNIDYRTLLHKKVCVIGRGNVGVRFADIFGVEPISPRDLHGLPTDADLYIIAVSDSAVADVAAKLKDVPGILVHTTGSVPMEALEASGKKDYGVFYPLQTLSKERSIEPERIPLMLEASNPQTMTSLKEIAKEYGFSIVREADSATRRRTHLAAAFACNFVNAMIGVGDDIMARSGLDPDALRPLIAETMAKLDTMTPKEAQTGPANRHDLPTLEKHKEELESLGMLQEKRIYEIISDYIMSL